MKKVIIALSSVVLLIVILVFLLYPKNTLTNDNSFSNNVKEETVIEEIKEEMKNESITENIMDNSSDVKTNSSSISNSNKDDMESNNASNSNVITKPKEPVKEAKETTTITESSQEPKQEYILVEEPIVKEEVQNDVIDTNSWFYSIHHGQIDTSTQEKCLSAGNEIAFIDTVDINYYRCYEVTSTTGKVLGYYLNIFCNSDNCNRYKNQIDMSKYK